MRLPALFVLLLVGLDLPAQLTVNCSAQNTVCSNPGGSISLSISGGVAPYTYLWSNGATTYTAEGLVPGTYSVTVTDVNMLQGTASCDVENDAIDWSQWVGQGGLSPCVGQCNGGFRVHHHPGMIDPVALTTIPPLNVIDGSGPNSASIATGGCPGAVFAFTVMDALGCGGSGTATIQAEFVYTVDVLQTAPTCLGVNDGSATVQVVMPPNFYEPPFLDVHVQQGGDQVQPFNAVVSGDTTTYFFSGLAPGNWTAYAISPPNEVGCTESQAFIIPDLGVNCGGVSGRVFLDEDQDCLQSVDEIGIAGRILTISPGPYYAITDANGDYNAGLPYGSYTLAQVDPDAVQLCPVQAPIGVDVINGFPDPVIVIADSLTTPYDLRAFLTHGTARPGFQFGYWAQVNNESGYPGDPVTLDLTWDPLFTFESSSVAPVNQAAGSAQWQLPAVPPFGHAGVMLVLQVPPDPALIGTTHSATLVVTSAATEVDASNNTTIEDLTVMGSFDPNDKQARTSSRISSSTYFLDADSYVDYTIRFQNTGNDTAFTVVVTDTISPLFDMATLELLGSSHLVTPSFIDARVLRFTFTDILLPDSTTNEALSHGFVSFRLAPDASVQSPGMLLSNNADIFFDFNPPVRTNTAELVTDFTVGIAAPQVGGLQVFPVPVQDQVNIRLPDGSTPVWLAVYGVDGRRVMQVPGASFLDLSALHPGAYVLQVGTGGGGSVHKRIVKR